MCNESKGSYGYNYNKQGYPIISKGEGNYLIDTKGKRYIDMFSACTANPWGNLPEIQETIISQSSKLMSYYDYYHPERIKLAANFVNYTNPSIYKIMFGVTGSEGISLALRLALYNCPNSTIYISKTGYHGTLMGINKLTNRSERDPYFPELKEVIPLSNLLNAKPNSIVLLEPYETANKGTIRFEYQLEQIVEHCKKNNILLIWDEIQTGMGRTGSFFVCNKINYWPDILVTGKSIGNGLPLSVVLFNKNNLKDWDGKAYSSTFTANPLTCAIGNTIFKLLFEKGWLDKIKEMGYYFSYSLTKKNIPHSSRGLYISIPLDSKGNINLIQKALSKGIFLRVIKDNVLLTPKYIITEGIIDKTTQIIKEII